MSIEEPPEWLPDGWTMEVRRGKTGNIYRYYTSPLSSYTFCSREAVMRYLNVVKVDGHESELAPCSGDESPRPVRQVKNSFKWLPPGWLLEIRTQRRCSKARQIFKSYLDPSTGSRFYSKGDVLQFVNSGKIYSPTSDQQRHCESESPEHVIAQIEFYPDGLPDGWYKETRIKKNKGGIRRDPYYADPVSGYVFRTLKDVQRYTETGEISKHAFRPRKRSVYDKYSLEKEDPLPGSAKKPKSPGIAVRRCLFSGHAQNSNGEVVIDIDELDEKPNLSYLDHASLQCIHCSLSVCPVPNINEVEEKATKSEMMFGPVIYNLSEPGKHLTGMENKERNEAPMPAYKKSLDSIRRFKRKAKRGRPKVSKQEKFMGKPSSEPANKSLDSLERKLLDLGDEIQPVLADEKPSEMFDKEPNETADMAPEQLLIEYPTQWENERSSEQENGKLTEGELLGKNEIEGPQQKKLLQPEDVKSPSPSEEKQPKPDGGSSSKAKTKKTATQPRRASKRLAGLEAGPPADDMRISYRFRWAMSKRRSHQTKDMLEKEQQETQEENGGGTALREQATEAGKPTATDDKLESPLTLPFGDSWPDPCLEFAFKTLTGSDIPVLEDGPEIQSILDHQHSSVQNSNPSVLASSSTFAGAPESSVKPTSSLDNNCWSSREEERPRPSITKNGLHSSGKVIQQYRRAAKLNQQ